MQNMMDLSKDYPNLLQHYDVLREIGSGGTATVFLCRSKRSRKQFACKTISRMGETAKMVDAQVEKEVRIMQKLSGCYGFVYLEEVIKDEHFWHLIMELCHCSLASRIEKKGKLSQKESALLIRNLAEIMQVLHSKGIVHRDLKSGNILVAGRPYDVRVSDFGFSDFLSADDPCFTDIVGAPRYVAPEVWQQRCSKEVDIWGLGLILYESLSGNVAFPRLNIDELKKLQCEGQDFAVWYLDWPVDGPVPKDATDLILAMLRPKPEDRISLQQILSHPWILKHCESSATSYQNKFEHQRSGGRMHHLHGKCVHPKNALSKLCQAVMPRRTIAC